MKPHDWRHERARDLRRRTIVEIAALLSMVVAAVVISIYAAPIYEGFVWFAAAAVYFFVLWLFTRWVWPYL